MRVAVHVPDGHELAGGDSGVSFAYRLGRVEDGVHNAPVGHEPVALDEFVQRLVAQAQEEYPDCEVRVERLVDNGDGSSRWISAEEFDPGQHVPVGAGQQMQREVTAAGAPATQAQVSQAVAPAAPLPERGVSA